MLNDMIPFFVGPTVVDVVVGTIVVGVSSAIWNIATYNIWDNPYRKAICL